jgi:hypothetical protein
MIVRRSFMQKSDSDLLASAETVLSECTQHSAEWVIEPIRLSDFGTYPAPVTHSMQTVTKPPKRLYRGVRRSSKLSDEKEVLALYQFYLIFSRPCLHLCGTQIWRLNKESGSASYGKK